MLSKDPDTHESFEGFHERRWNLRKRTTTVSAVTKDNSDSLPPKRVHRMSPDADEMGNLKGFVDYSDLVELIDKDDKQPDDSSSYSPSSSPSSVSSSSSSSNSPLGVCNSDDDFQYSNDRFEYLPTDMDEIDLKNDRAVISSLAGGSMDLKKHLRRLSRKERIELFKIEKAIRKGVEANAPLKLRILRMGAPTQIKIAALERYDLMERSGTGHSEYPSHFKWLNCVLSIPWNVNINLPIADRRSPHEINNFLYRAQQLMDREIYGLNGAKMSVLEALGKYISKEDSSGLVVGIEGSPGVGKTVLMREGVAEAFGRPFITIPLGGARDGCYLDGSNSVYQGSTYGKIVESLIGAKCMNPVFYFDELDKLSETQYGRELSNVLVHLTDPSQNHDFEDKYLGLRIDMSKAIFIFSYNDVNKIDPILRDRIRKIVIKDYSIEDKIRIVKEYALKKILHSYNFLDTDIIVAHKVIRHTVSKYANAEAGVRELLRCFDIIVSKLNMLRLVHSELTPHRQSTESRITINYDIPSFRLPYELSIKDVDRLMKNISHHSPRVYE